MKLVDRHEEGQGSPGNEVVLEYKLKHLGWGFDKQIRLTR
jgi:hypothetical protein